MLDKNRLFLKDTVQQAVAAAVRGKKFAPPATNEPELLAHRGCFVTLKTFGQLRGCMGVFIADRPLIEMAVEMAYSSSQHDPRFEDQRIHTREIDDLEIEISVLSELEKAADPLSLELGVHGIYIKKGRRSGCFLPQVAVETGWTKEEFLSYCCTHKAGLSQNAWKEPSTEVYLFTAEIIF